MPHLYGEACQESQEFAGWAIMGGGVELVGLPRTTIPSQIEDVCVCVGGVRIPKQGQRRGSLAYRGGPPFFEELRGAIWSWFPDKNKI